jgi:PPOX class probable F420-dependent enzyme
MTSQPSQETISRLQTHQNIWISSVRPDGRPHLVPVWFVWHTAHIFISADPASVKVRNIRSNPRVTLALEDGTHPVIIEGLAELIGLPLPQALWDAFFQKYEWDIHTDPQYHQVIEIAPVKWLAW